MSKKNEHYTVLQVRYIPDSPDAQPNKDFRLGEGESTEEALKRCLGPNALAYRFYNKEVINYGGLIGLLWTSEDVSNHTPWTFVQGSIYTVEMLLVIGVPQITIEFWYREGRTRALVVRGSMIIYIRPEDVVLSQVK